MFKPVYTTDNNRLKRVLREHGFEVHSEWLHEKINEKAYVEAFIEEHARDGKLAVYIWQADCDGYEWDTVTTIDASYAAFDALRESVYMNAEGPNRCHLITWEELEWFRPMGRDATASAHEDGHAYSISFVGARY